VGGLEVHGHGFYAGLTTWARHARSFFTALHRRTQVKIHPVDHRGVRAELTAEESALMWDGSDDHDGIGIGIGSVDSMPAVRGRHRIAFVVWETTRLPADKRAQLQAMDEVWTPSRWGREMFVANGLAPERVFVVPEGVDTNRFVPRPRGPEEEPFRFLCVGKWEARKGVGDLVRCFAETFSPDENVELVIHAHNQWLPGFDSARVIRTALGGRPARVRASEPVNEDGLAALYTACDAFVLPTRAEGWGLPIAEAMSCGLPVIVTNYSAPAEVVHEGVGYPLRVAGMTAVRDPYFYPGPTDFGVWAEPDWEHLRTLLRWVADHKEEAAAKGRQARQEACARWTWDHAAEVAMRRLREIGA